MIVHKMNEPRAIYISEALNMAIKALEQQPCEDAISRQAVMNALCDECELFKNGEQTCFTKCEEYHFLATLPPVTPQPKTGHWEKHSYFKDAYICSSCNTGGNMVYKDFKYCPNCGAKMGSEEV